ncbi:MAG: hypothetical protein M3525_08375 [Acidobacteriota bacterium]|nr:hypothetical protein [Acidobacteriota bacterium]
MILATVSIVKCDDCKKIIALKTDEEWERYERNWSDSLLHQFCPVCRGKIENRGVIEADNKSAAAILGKEKEEKWAEVIN